MTTLGVIFAGLGFFATMWHLWHIASGRPLPNFFGYRYTRRGLLGNSLRIYSSVQVAASICLILLGVGMALGLSLLIGVGLVGAVFGVAVDIVVFAPIARRKRTDSSDGALTTDNTNVNLGTTPGGMKSTILAYSFPLYLVVTFGAVWAIDQLLPATVNPPSSGYARTTATVEGVYPNDHDRVKYGYQVGVKSFEAVWFANGSEGDASALKVGQTITIWYEVGDPSKSCYCTDPHELQRTYNDPTPVVLAVVILLTGGYALIGGRLIFGRWFAVVEWAEELVSARRPTQT